MTQSDISDKTSVLIEILLYVTDQTCDEEKPAGCNTRILIYLIPTKDSLTVYDLKSCLSF